MRKISFALIASLLLLASNLNATTASIENETKNCFGLASWVYDFVIENGGSVIDAVNASADALEECAATIGFE